MSYYILEVHRKESDVYQPLPLSEILMHLKSIPKGVVKLTSQTDPTYYKELGTVAFQLSSLGYKPHLVTHVPTMTEPMARVLTTFFKSIEITSPPATIKDEVLQENLELLRRATPNITQIKVRDTERNRKVFGSLVKYWDLTQQVRTMPAGKAWDIEDSCLSSCEGAVAGDGVLYPCVQFMRKDAKGVSRKETRDLIAAGVPHPVCVACPRLQIGIK